MYKNIRIFMVIFFLFSSAGIYGGELTLEEIAQREFVGKKRFSKRQFDKTWKHLKKKEQFVKYQIISGKPYGPSGNVLSLLTVLSQKYRLPDIEFIYYNFDCLGDKFSEKYTDVPIFVSARKKIHNTHILFADWYYDINDHSTFLGWNNLYQTIKKQSSILCWKEKFPTLVWRGATNDGYYTPQNWSIIPRGYLVSLSKKMGSNFIDAQFSNYYAWTVSDVDYFNKLLGVSSLSPSEQIAYRYQIDVDGVTSTFSALPWKLLSGSLVFKQKSDNIMWFHHALRPGEHYIELSHDLRNLPELFSYAQDHDEEMRKIAASGRDFAVRYLSPDSILEYCYHALIQYSRLKKE